MSFHPLTALDSQRLEETENVLCEVFNLPEVRDYQAEAGRNMLLGIDTILDAPTGAGKTLAFYYALFYHCWTGSNEEGSLIRFSLSLARL